MALPDTDWLPTTGVKPSVYGYMLATGDVVPNRFDEICTTVHGSRLLPQRIPQVREALSRYLRSRFRNTLPGQPIWDPEQDRHRDRFRPYRSIIRPLLAHPQWSQLRVVAAPVTLYSPQHHAAGSLDALAWQPDGSLVLLTLITAPRDSIEDQRAIHAELGAGVAALNDLYLQVVTHCIACWAKADETLLEFISPDLCLTSWVQTVEAHQFRGRLDPEQAQGLSLIQEADGFHSVADGHSHLPSAGGPR
jgi:hypothetical protein